MKRYLFALLAAGLLTVSYGAADAQAQRIRISGGGRPGIVYRGGGPYRNYNVNRGYYSPYGGNYYGGVYGPGRYNTYYNGYGYNGYGYGGYGYGGYYRAPGYYSQNFGVNPNGLYLRF